MNDINSPPSNKNELLSRITSIIENGPYDLPEKGFGGSGGPGMYLEKLLGLTAGNKDIPDSLGWELKYFSPRTNYITLFHKEPKPEGIVRYLVSKYGWEDQKGRLSFRHTISGRSDRFRVDGEAGQITIRPIVNTDGPVAYWTEDDILGAAGAKLRRLLLVRGSKSENKVIYDRAEIYETLGLSHFIEAVVKGIILIDFDARESKPGSKGLRNHGTKFRVSPNDISKLYVKKERVC